MAAVRYDKTTGPSGGPTPGAIALRDHWRKVTGLGDQGIYNPRKVRGSKTTWSTHASGRAVDLKANAHNARERQLAEGYIEFLQRHCVALQVQYLIWNGRSWSPARGWREYNGVHPHEDHVHAELNIDGGRSVTLAKLDALWARDNQPKDDDDVNKLLVLAKIEYAYRLFGREPHTKREAEGLRYWIDQVNASDDPESVEATVVALLWRDAAK